MTFITDFNTSDTSDNSASDYYLKKVNLQKRFNVKMSGKTAVIIMRQVEGASGRSCTCIANILPFCF